MAIHAVYLTSQTWTKILNDNNEGGVVVKTAHFAGKHDRIVFENRALVIYLKLNPPQMGRYQQLVNRE